MKITKLTLAITFVASALLCACDDSSSAKDNASENDASSTQPPPQSDAFTTNEQYTYVFYYNGKECGGEPSIVNIQYKLAPSSSNAKMIIKDPNETTTETGMFRTDTDDNGKEFYLIQTNDSEVTYYYYPNEMLVIEADDFINVLSKSSNDINKLIAKYCAE